MWFKSVYLKTLRDFRVAIFGWGVGLGFLMYAVLAAVAELTATAQARASLVSLAQSFAWIAEPIQVDTPGGYATWKYGFTILVLALWPILVSSRMLRGEEQRGVMDVLLSVPQTRLHVALQKVAAVGTALLAMGVLIGLLTFMGGAKAAANFGLGGALLFGLNIALIAAVFGALALLVSQFTHESGAASGITGGLLLFFIVIDMLHRVIPNTELISRFSPVYYYNLSKPLIPSYGANPGALLVMVALCVALTGAALWLFARRDVGAAVALPRWLSLPERSVTPARALPVNAWSLRSVYTRGLGMLAVPTAWWTLGIAGLAAWLVVIAKQTEKNLATLYTSSPFLKDFLNKLGGSDVTTNATLLSALFTFLPLLLMIFAISQASRWSSDEEDGRLELVLATPQSRLRVILGRFAALTTALVVIGALTLVLCAVAAQASGFTLDLGNLAAAALGMIPLGLLIAAIGYLLSGWITTAIDTGLLSFLLVLWFFISFVGPAVSWPDATLRLSAFYYYGTPLLHGLSVGDTLAILLVGALALVVATVRFARKDIGR